MCARVGASEFCSACTIRLHDPAEKMPLLEIIAGEQTSDATLARAFDLAQQLGKTPIVVNDGPGFFTSRVISKTIAQGSNMWFMVAGTVSWTQWAISARWSRR